MGTTTNLSDSGEAKANIAELEPQIRYADVLGLNISALNHQDGPGAGPPSAQRL